MSDQCVDEYSALYGRRERLFDAGMIEAKYCDFDARFRAMHRVQKGSNAITRLNE
jgi:hypothetical protein